MMSLYNADIWNEVLRRCDIPELTCLWGCGNKTLQSIMRIAPRLKTGGIYQRCLRHLLGLTDLDLSSDVWISKKTTAALPPNVTRLTINNITNNYQLHALPHSLTALRIQIESPIINKKVQPVDLTILPSSLIELEVYGVAWVDLPVQTIEGSSEFMPHFPNLTHLSIRCIQFFDSRKIFYHCPKLVKLTTSITIDDLRSCPLSPNISCLEELTVNYYPGSDKGLLKSVTKAGVVRPQFPLLNDIKLDVVEFSSSTLPSWVTNLTVTTAMGSQQLEVLPITLTSLCITCNNNDEFAGVFNRFPLLRVLCLSRSYSVNNADNRYILRDLPHTLEILKAANYYGVEVPSSVTDLDLTHFKLDSKLGSVDINDYNSNPSINAPSLLAFIPIVRKRVGISTRPIFKTGPLNVIRRESSIVTLHERIKPFRSLVGVSSQLLTSLHDFTRLETIMVEYHSDLIELFTTLSQYPSLQLRELTIHGYYSKYKELERLLVSCSTIYSLYILRIKMSDFFYKHNKNEHSTNIRTAIMSSIRTAIMSSIGIDTNTSDKITSKDQANITNIITLPPYLKELMLIVDVNLPGLCFPPSLKVLLMEHDVHFTEQQLLQLSHSALRDVSIRSTMTIDDAWDLLHALPISTQRIALTLDQQGGRNPITEKDLQQYLSQRKRKRTLHRIDVAMVS